MLLFSILSAIVTAGLLGAALLWTRRQPDDERQTAREDYARFVVEMDRRVANGVVEASLAHEEKLEAARALLKADAAGEGARRSVSPLLGLIGAFVIAGGALGLYLVTGKPELPDQPYQQRLEAWMAQAETQPETMASKPLSEVLKRKAAENTEDPQYWMFLGRLQVMSGDYYDGAKSFRVAVTKAPDNAEAWSNMGEALTLMNEGKSGPDARTAFEEALKRDPNDLSGQYYMGKVLIAEGRFEAARAMLGGLREQLPVGDPRRQAVETELAALEQAQTVDAQTRGQIAGMVAGLEARLADNQENPDGWARLLRSYRVLGDVASETRVLADIERIYQKRPEIKAAIIEKANRPVGSQ
ncbi:MAG: c-type cytochrome biogenesis protein CcmI [Asticcacaulis sp.]